MLNTLNSLMVFSYKQIVVSALLCLSLVGCVSKTSVKPIDSQASASKLFAKDPKSDAFNQYLIQHGYPKESLPLSTWDIDTLTLCALFYHTDLAVDKEQLALAELAIATAGTKPFSTINGTLARSNQANGDIRPWSYGLTIDIPLTTHNKREIRIEKAVQHAEVIRM
ncbi:MAG: TolC family protein, partial [Methylophilaceae bacterium]|nr:TolC family protein [Methylophilaceae bacterium]